jgi:hypothetical protein
MFAMAVALALLAQAQGAVFLGMAQVLAVVAATKERNVLQGGGVVPRLVLWRMHLVLNAFSSRPEVILGRRTQRVDQALDSSADNRVNLGHVLV